MTNVSSPMRRPGDDRAPAARREPRDALPAGTVLGGGYRVERTLGQGGFGIVYLATDLALQRPLAIKEYLPVQLAGRGQGPAIGLREAGHKDAFLRGLDSFLREARLLAQFDHPALVRVYRFWEENHTAYMAMPYCEGPTLMAARQTMLRPPDEHWLRDRLLLPLLGALETLHAAQCLHRDVAPGNILLKSDGQPVLLDFGSARRVVADMTQPLTAIINPSFAAIEQYAESSTLPQGPWTDVYGLAAVAYFALSGRAPVPATVRAVNDAALMPMAEVAREVERSFPGLRYSAPFLAALDAALAVRPGERPQSAAALRDALTRTHVQPDVTVEGPPLQAVPRKPAEDGGAEPLAAAPEAADDEPGEQAIRAAIDAALADISDWPPMSRRPGRIDPVLVPDIPPREETPNTAEAAPTNKVALKVVPGGEPASPPPAPGPAQPAVPAKPTGPVPTITAEVPAVPPPSSAWMATMPAIGAMQVPPPPPAAPEPKAVTEPPVVAEPPTAAALPAPPAKPSGATSGAPSPTPAQAEARQPVAPVAPVAPVVPLPPAQPAPEAAAEEKVTEPMQAWLPHGADLSFEALARDEDRPALRRRSTWPWALAAALVALVAGGGWYLQQQGGLDARFAGGVSTPSPELPRAEAPTARPVAAAPSAPAVAAASAPPPAVTPQVAVLAPAPASAVLPTTSPAASAALPPMPDVLAAAPPAPPSAEANTPGAGNAPAAEPETPVAEATPPRRSTTSSSGTTSARNGASTPRKTADATPTRANTSATRPRQAAAPTQTAAAPKTPADPRAVCGGRSNFSLYYCMKTQCRQPRFAGHPQCVRLRETDEVS